MATSPRSLRIGVLLGDQLVEERVFPPGAPITLGQSLRCALSIPVDGVPREHVLFTSEGGRFALHETPGMQVRRDDGRGRIVLGEVTILFQEVATLPPAPRPQLPAAIRGTLADRIDRRLALFVGGSLLVHVAIAAWAWTSDVPTTPLGYSPVATTYHEDMIDVTLPDIAVTTPTDAPTAPAIATPVAPTQTPRPIVRPTHVQRPTSGDDAERLASILAGDADEGPSAGGMRARQPGADLDRQLDEARGHAITIGDGTHTSRTDDRARMGTAPDAPLVDDPTLTRVPTRPRDEPTGRIAIGPVKPDESTTLTPATVLDRINTLYMTGLKRCYKDGLKLDASLGGRVAISFTVDVRGQVIDESAGGVSSGVDACIQTQMRRWRFPVPKDKDGDATDASFAVSLALQPS